MTPVCFHKHRWLPRTDAKIIGGVLGLVAGLVSPSNTNPSAALLFEDLDRLLSEHPLRFVVAMVGCAGLCGAVMYIAVLVQIRRWRPQMSDRRRPTLFRKIPFAFRCVLTIAAWAGIGFAVGLSVRMLLAITGVNPPQPYAYLILVACSGLSAGLGGLAALSARRARRLSASAMEDLQPRSPDA